MGVQPADPDSRNKSVHITLGSSHQDKLFGFHRQFYSSDWERMPCYRERKATGAAAETESQEPSPKFAIGRGFVKPIFVVLVRQDAKRPDLSLAAGSRLGFFHANPELFCDDPQSLTLASVIQCIEMVIEELRKSGQPACSDVQWRRVKESGVLAFKQVAAHVEGSAPAQDDLMKAQRLLRDALRDHREGNFKRRQGEPEAWRGSDPTFAPRPRDLLFRQSAVETAQPDHPRSDQPPAGSGTARGKSKADPAKQADLVAELAGDQNVWHAGIVGVWRVRPAGGAAGREDDEEDDVIDQHAADGHAVTKRRGPRPVIRFESVFHLWVAGKLGEGDGLARKRQAEALGESRYPLMLSYTYRAMKL